MSKSQIVSVYGSARVPPDHPVWQQAEALGKLLAENGYTVMNGGYGGVMEAASKGAQSANGEVIGVTVGLFERTGRRSGANPYVTEEIRHESLTDRLLHVVRECDAAVACGGGIGTVSELSLIWSFVQTGEVPPVPIIMLGEQWQKLIDLLNDGGVYISDHDLSFVKIANTPQDVIDMLANWD